ncbi:MAG: serine hydrolase domain-containing protein [Phenylobacterium sp.]
MRRMRRLALLLALAALPLAVQSARAQASDPLIGLWSWKTVSQPRLHGPLTLTRRGAAWAAAIAGKSATGRTKGAALRLRFAGEGEFRGRIGPHGPEGFWVQPAGRMNDPNDPGGSGQAFATPLAFRPAGANAWRTDVRPLPSPFTLWLKVFRDADGALVGAFRNPEMNSIGGRTQFLVARDGEAVHFTSRPAPGRKPVALEARLVGGRLSMVWPDVRRTIELTRPAAAEAAAFYSRPPNAPPYVYAPPPQLDDGWPVARASSVGIDEAALARIVQAQAVSDPAAARPSLMHAILVAHRGKLVLEEYFFGYDRARPHDTRSAAKTFGSVMLGAAMLKDPALGPDSRIYELMAGLGPFANPDPRKAQITLAHLMTHTSGLACDDNDDASPGNEATMQTQTGQPNWWKYTLDLPMAHDPGSRYAYCSANSNLVGGAIATRLGVWLPDYFDQMVARALQFGRWYWNLTPTGDGYSGGGAYLLPRDLLKVGQAFLDGGLWHGRRIVSADWVKVSTAPHEAVSPVTTGLSPDDFGNFYALASDGYAWHLGEFKVGDRVYKDYEATGNGGQLLIVVPDADLVVAFTGGNYGQGGIWGRWKDAIVAQQIIPAMQQ